MLTKTWEEHVEIVCQPGKGEETCAYLGLGTGNFMCLKSTSFEIVIASRVVAKKLTAQGNNCSGPPDYTVFNDSP